MSDQTPTPADGDEQAFEPTEQTAAESAVAPEPIGQAADEVPEPTADAISEPAVAPADVDTDPAPTSDAAADGDSGPATTADGVFDAVAEAFAAAAQGPAGVDETAPPQYGIGPFSIREVALGGVWLLAFVISFFPLYTFGPGTAGPSVWNGLDWVLRIALPTVGVFLLALRRLSPQGIRRVGSLGIDQFASVAFSVAAVAWLEVLWSFLVASGGVGGGVVLWVVWGEFILMLAGVLLTVFAPFFPTIGDDFQHRTEVPAHRLARPARPIAARPAKPAAAGPSAAPHSVVQEAAAPVAQNEPAQTQETAAEPVQTVSPPQAFWALAPEERPVVDAEGNTLFTIGPTAWALVIEDRGDAFVVRHEDGRIGFLRDVTGVTRG